MKETDLLFRCESLLLTITSPALGHAASNVYGPCFAPSSAFLEAWSALRLCEGGHGWYWVVLNLGSVKASFLTLF